MSVHDLDDGGPVVRPLNLDAGLAGTVGEPHYAIVDIGSNSVRMVVYDRLGRAPLPRYVEKSLCRLGDGLAETEAISQDGFHRTVEALRRFRAIADAMGVSRIDATATEAIRRATNGRELVAAIKNESGLDIHVLEGEEEARFSALGVISGFYRPVGVIGDMGGGSLEVAQALDDRGGDFFTSLPLGALPVELLLQRGLARAKRQVDELMRENLPTDISLPSFYAVGGGWRTLAKVHMASTNAVVPVVHGYSCDTQTIRDFCKHLLKLPREKLAAVPGLPERRVRTTAAAALVLDRLLKRLKPKQVVFSALGLREGWLYAQLGEEQRYLDPIVEGARLIGLPQARVPQFQPALVQWTASLFSEETHAAARLRVAVCALSDIAWRDDADLRAEESFRRLLRMPFIGLGHAERVFIAAAIHARYAGKPDALCLFPAIKMLSSTERRRALILGRAILVAYRFSGSAPDVLARSRLSVQSKRLRLEVDANARAPDSEVVGSRLKLLSAAMGLRRFEVIERAAI